jgi:hypothetical protein
MRIKSKESAVEGDKRHRQAFKRNKQSPSCLHGLFGVQHRFFISNNYHSSVVVTLFSCKTLLNKQQNGIILL